MTAFTKTITTVTNDGAGISEFSSRDIQMNGDERWLLSDQQGSVNFRLRSSHASYKSDWHVAGDPTLLIILRGELEIELRSGCSRRFASGEMFIAEDFLLPSIKFSNTHGHRATVVSSKHLEALHLKLERLKT